MDIRLVMAAMAQRVGANGQLGLVRAQQPENAPALAVVGGPFDMSSLSSDHEAVRAGQITIAHDGAVTLHRPLVIWESAELLVSGGVDLALDRASGAFLLNLGGLTVSDAGVSAIGDASQSSPAFRPFVLTAGVGAVQVVKGRFEGLGYADSAAFGGFAVVNRGIFPAIGESRVEESDFDDLSSVLFEGSRGATFRKNWVRDTRGAGLILKQTIETEVSGNRVQTSALHGIRISSGATGARVRGNRIEDAGKIGIFVDGASRNVDLEGNRVSGAKGDGILVKRSGCIRVRGNSVRTSGGNGIVIHRSTSVALNGNAIERNRRAGILLRNQPAGAETSVTENILAANTSGISGEASARIRLIGNDFSEQFPRLVAGDLALGAHGLFADPAGQLPIVLEPAGGKPSAPPPPCPIIEGA
ncbi:right-handed parallel beta-helix repeat-containing protein [Tropicimonas marinistellae]|uniref:right-handed parallel beta-helix repeat-containing protein n=1 Tax=Tropicimonas marinistellae TaxID=1739787 RepID=UPI00082C66BD|nr:right-handed parallel beta-helix repeat-containing protein [Tropicimonas marinistellae]